MPHGLPVVETTQVPPSLSMPRKLWAAFAASIASIAACNEPSVEFLKPTGIESPLAICRWVGLSVVRAPIAPSTIVSAMYCGVIGSRHSVAVGSPMRAISIRSVRPSRSPAETSKESSRWGSLMSPFQPTVVRGFSK
jgi:hypothetical protein